MLTKFMNALTQTHLTRNVLLKYIADETEWNTTIIAICNSEHVLSFLDNKEMNEW